LTVAVLFQNTQSVTIVVSVTLIAPERKTNSYGEKPQEKYAH